MPSDGASDDHCDEGDDHKMIKCSTWKRRKRKTKPYGVQGKGIAGFGAFRENEVHIFYCAGGKFGEVAGVFLAEEYSPDAGSEAPDTVSERPVCRQCLAQLG